VRANICLIWRVNVILKMNATEITAVMDALNMAIASAILELTSRTATMSTFGGNCGIVHDFFSSSQF
jgi:hypothetical protein